MLQSSLVNNLIPLILIRGGGDLASGVALRLHRAALNVVITEQSQPLAVRRLVSFAEAVYRSQITVEGVTAVLVKSPADVPGILKENQIPVIVDSHCAILADPTITGFFNVIALVDARMMKAPPDLGMQAAPLVIGLGPGFSAGSNCHAVIETNRGHFLGRVIWGGSAQADTGIPGSVARHQADRVLRAPAEGIFHPQVEIGSSVIRGQVIAVVKNQLLIAPFDGVIRGLLHSGLAVTRGMKVGDVDARNDPNLARLISEKSLAVGGGVLEALLSRPEIRKQLWI